MKIYYFVILFMIGFSFLFSETNNISKLGNLSIGTKFNLNFSQAPKDFAFGIEISSPLLFNRIGLNCEIDFSFLRGIKKTAIIKNEVVFNYLTYKVGIFLSTGNKEDFIRPYLKIGWIFLDTKNEIFSATSYSGIYGSFGMNISFEKINLLCFFVEVSSYGFFNEVFVENLVGSPNFGEGIIFSVGLKIII